MANTGGQLRKITFNQTFESSLAEKNNQKFSVDKSLIKGIKQNDVSKIIDQNSVSGGTQNIDLFNQYKQVEGMVIDTRKKFDKIKTQGLKSEDQIYKLKQQKEQLLDDQSKYNTLIQNQRKQLHSTQERLIQISSFLDAITYRKDIYTNMREVTKSDLLVLKKRYFDRDVTLMRQGTKLRTLRTQHQSKHKLSKRCRQILQSVEKSVTVKQIQRNTKIQSFCDVLARKQSHQQNRQIRQRQIQQVMMSAMTDKLAQQKQWIKMLNANLFLKGILKAKMQRLMERYNKIQLSFHKMKQATSIKDSNEFIQRFITREQTYGMLLESIAEKQKQLEEIKEERDQLEKIHHIQIYKFQQLGDEKKKKQPKNLQNFQSKNPTSVLNQLNMQTISIMRKKQLMYQWASKFLAVFNGHPNRETITKSYPKNKGKQIIIQVLNTIKKFLNKIQSQQNHGKKIQEAFLKNNPKQKILNEQNLQKNIRVKTLSTYDNQGMDSFQDKDVAYDDLSEVDYLQYNRKVIKKSDIQNRKFRIKTKPN